MKRVRNLSKVYNYDTHPHCIGGVYILRGNSPGPRSVPYNNRGAPEHSKFTSYHQGAPQVLDDLKRSVGYIRETCTSHQDAI